MAIVSTGTNGTTAGSAQSATASSALSTSSNSSDQFMKMLLTQLTNQDPTQPMSASDMTQQMVGIQQIESTQTLQQQITTMNQQGTASAANIIGLNVQVTPNAGGSAISGTVTSLRQSTANGLQVVVGGTAYSMADVTSINLPSTSTSTP